MGKRYIDVEAINRGLAVALLEDGSEVPIIVWMAAGDPDCDPRDAASCVAGPCCDGGYYAIDLSKFETVCLQ